MSPAKKSNAPARPARPASRRARSDASHSIGTPVAVSEPSRWPCGLCAEPVANVAWPQTGMPDDGGQEIELIETDGSLDSEVTLKHKPVDRFDGDHFPTGRESHLPFDEHNLTGL